MSSATHDEVELEAYCFWLESAHTLHTVLINPRRPCIVRVTVVGSVCLSVCPLSKISLIVPQTIRLNGQ